MNYNRRTQESSVEINAGAVILHFCSINLRKSKPAARVKKSVYRHLVLNGPYLIQGQQYEITGKPLGAGIFEVTPSVKED